jgi:hypothetical protein
VPLPTKTEEDSNPLHSFKIALSTFDPPNDSTLSSKSQRAFAINSTAVSSCVLV